MILQIITELLFSHPYYLRWKSQCALIYRAIALLFQFCYIISTNYSLLPHDSVPHIYGGPPKEGAQGCENFVLALAFQPCLRNSRNVGPTLVATPEH